MPETYYIIPKDKHDSLVTKAYRKRGYDAAEAAAGARFCASAAYYGIRTHNAIKALHIEAKHRAGGGGSVPGAEVRRLPGRFAASQVWDAQRKLGLLTIAVDVQNFADLAIIDEAAKRWR